MNVNKTDFRTESEENGAVERPLVSVVVTTKNEEKNIEQCLRSISLQTYGNIESIVIDNFSTDKTKEIALQYTDKVYEKGPERSAQRNYGMTGIASGKYVMFVDADMVLSPRLVGSCVDYIESQRSDAHIVALHIPEIVLGKSYWNKVRRFERTFYDGTVIDGARFFLKDAFIKVGGFDEGMSGPEDWDLDKKIKQAGKIGLVSGEGTSDYWEMRDFIMQGGVDPLRYGSVIYHNETEFNLKKYLTKKGYYAQSFDAYINKWGKNDPDVSRQLGLRYRFFIVFLENGKWKRLFRRIHLSFGMYLLRFLVGIKFLMQTTYLRNL